MATRSDVWSIVEPVVKGHGLELFDIDVASKRGGTMRVYIWSGKETGGVNLDQCAAVSKELSALPTFETLLPENALLEVSSPGVNRRLRLPEHFAGSIGERVQISYRVPVAEGRTGKEMLVGTLEKFDGESLEISTEPDSERRIVPFADVDKARVDFIF